MVKTPVCKCLKYRLYYATVGFDTAAAANPSTGNPSPDGRAAPSACRSGMMACGMGHHGLKGLLILAVCCGAPLVLALVLPMLGSALGGLGVSVVHTLALLACPVGMVLMMWLMRRGQQAGAHHPAPPQSVTLPPVATTPSAGPQEAGALLDDPLTIPSTVAPPPLVDAEIITSPRSINGHQTARPTLPVNGQQAAAPTPAAIRTQAAIPPQE